MKEVKSVTELKLNSETTAEYDTIIVETDDDIRYVFGVTSDYIGFSHRYNPHMDGSKVIDQRNFRMPLRVRECMKDRYGGYILAEGMIKQAKTNKDIFAKYENRVS